MIVALVGLVDLWFVTLVGWWDGVLAVISLLCGFGCLVVFGYDVGLYAGGLIVDVVGCCLLLCVVD